MMRRRFWVHMAPVLSGPSAAVLVSSQEFGAPEAVVTFEALGGPLLQVQGPMSQGFVQRASSPSAHLTHEPGLSVEAPRWVSEGVVHQQQPRFREGTAGADGTGEPFEEHTHGADG